MRIHQLLTITGISALISLVAASCSSGGDGAGAGGGGGSGAGDVGGTGSGHGTGGAPPTTWYTTCGDPVCGAGGAGGGMPPVGVNPCTNEKEGDDCTNSGATCWPGGTCGVLLYCADKDPKSQPGGCPISRARYKKDIDYLPESSLQAVHDDLMTMPLATWRYSSEPAAARKHLGFIIDDNPTSPAVAANGDQVDLYGYTSMTVAAVQVQDKRIDDFEREIRASDRRIDELEREIRALREELKALRAGVSGRFEP